MNDDLKELDAMFAEIGGNEKLEENANDFATVEDGTYEAEVVKAEFATSKSNLPMIKLEFALETKAHCWKYLMLAAKPGPDQAENTRRQMSRSITDLRKFGLEADSVSGYVSQLDKLTGVGCTLRLETKGEFQNVHIEEVH